MLSIYQKAARRPHLSSAQSTAMNPCAHSKFYRSAEAEQKEKVQVICYGTEKLRAVKDSLPVPAFGTRCDQISHMYSSTNLAATFPGTSVQQLCCFASLYHQENRLV